MKYLLLVITVLLLVWLVRGGRRRIPPARPGAAPAAGEAKVQDMVACASCGVHLPRAEALPGRGGLFCGEAHRREFEQQHAGP